MTRTLDVICLGRAAVDLYGDQFGDRLEDMQTFSKSLGGSSGNLAAGLARLGSRSSMLTRVGDEQMGRFVREQLAREGVDVTHVVTDPDRLTGLVILGIANRDSFPHIFYRERCADMGVTQDDFDESYIASSRALAITGTHLSTTQSYDVVARAIDFAAANGTKVVLDIDYRPILWGLTSAGGGEERYVQSDLVTQRIQSLLDRFDLLIGTEEEINIAGGSDDVLHSLQEIRSRSDATIVLKRGPLGCTVLEHEIPSNLDDAIAYKGVQVEVMNVLGAGDAFLSGFLHAWLNEKSWADCATYGNACGALVVSRHACTPAMPTAIELEDYLERAETVDRPDKDARIDYLHRASTRNSVPDQLMVLAFDHRRQLEDLVQDTEAPGTRISAFKSLICQAVEEVAGDFSNPEQLGVIVDDRYGESVLHRLTDKQYWIGRPVEVPGSRPLELDPRNNFGLTLLGWPKSHVVKCLVFYHPADSIEMRLTQERRVQDLYADCKSLDRDLLLEIICTGNGQPTDDCTTANVLRRFYNLGVVPAWWKLESMSAHAWQEVDSVIQQYDPLCNGVLMLGLDAPEAELRDSFGIAARFAVCKGFAVGRSIFGQSARQWFAGDCDDATVVRQVAANYRSIIQNWQDAVSDAKVSRRSISVG